MITVLALAIVYKRALESRPKKKIIREQESQKDGQTKPADYWKSIGRAPTEDKAASKTTTGLPP
ncbi:hypothetical protein L873DRAFT_1816897 [Choiromyces venosus 120613-1]|uniref:Uncharacterized protein n=1 Tax=Choiromyces venosus 120613-1 TaxID=1336337 RepID=A0A3N4J7C4_9PEZI|nr:hypothetical protein L873DRAFT_1816897 [Choiromyces venosus 120613-1]